MPRPDVSDARIPQILEAAAQVFAKYGVDGASMTQVAQQSKLSKAAIYHYFESKDTLIEALVKQLFSADMPQLNHMLHADEPTLIRLRNYVQNLLVLLTDQHQLRTVVTELRARAARVPALQVVVSHFFSNYVSAFETVLRQGIAKGEIAVDINVALTANALAAMIEGSIVLAYSLDVPLQDILVSNVDMFLSQLEV